MNSVQIPILLIIIIVLIAIRPHGYFTGNNPEQLINIILIILAMILFLKLIGVTGIII